MTFLSHYDRSAEWFFFFFSFSGDKINWGYFLTVPAKKFGRTLVHTEPFNIFALFMFAISVRNFLACSQTLYFLFKVLRARVIKKNKATLYTGSRDRLVIFLSFSSCVTTHPCSHAFADKKISPVMVFTHLAVQIFDRTGQNFDLNFNVQIFERLGVQIFVRLARFLVKEVPNRTNFRPVKNSTSSVWT